MSRLALDVASTKKDSKAAQTIVDSVSRCVYNYITSRKPTFSRGSRGPFVPVLDPGLKGRD